MYAPTEELTRIANNSRDAFTAALNAWAEAAQRYATDFDAKHPVPDAAETQAAIDTAYDLAGKLLAEQHAWPRTVVAASKEATDAVAERFRTSRRLPGCPPPSTGACIEGPSDHRRGAPPSPPRPARRRGRAALSPSPRFAGDRRAGPSLARSEGPRHLRLRRSRVPLTARPRRRRCDLRTPRGPAAASRSRCGVTT